MPETSSSSINDFLESGGVVLEPGSQDYPEAVAETSGLRKKEPPTLYVYGNLEPIYTPGIGLCGSRSVSEGGWQIAMALGEAATGIGKTLISGYALGVDTAGQIAAIAAGGHTIAVLAEGIGKFRIRPEYPDHYAAEERMTVVSQFPIESGWTTINAMTRNFTICALASALVAIEPGEKGGTLNAAQEALRQSKPLFVVTNPEAGKPSPAVNRLLKRGAVLIRDENELRDAVARMDAEPVGQQGEAQPALL